MKRIATAPDQESVWDYPRPPRVEPTGKLVQVFFAGLKIAETWHSLRVLETSHPPTYYLPPEDVDLSFLIPSDRRTFCEFKGGARYFTLSKGEHRSPDAAWTISEPTAGYLPATGGR